MDDCLFCKIVEGEIPADIVYENDTVVAFRDINPQAPTHILIIPREHISTINDLAAAEGLTDKGYRVVMNCGEGAGQSVFHIHLHLLGGRGFDWPPG